MTTIAYKDGVVACDSIATQDDIIIELDRVKYRRVGKRVYFFSGATSDQDFLVTAFEKRDRGITVPDKCQCSAVVIDQDAGKVYDVRMNSNGFWWDELPPEEPFAIGTGRDFALSAMDLGASAREAVGVAIRRDPYSGGRIRSVKV